MDGDVPDACPYDTAVCKRCIDTKSLRAGRHERTRKKKIENIAGLN